MNASLTIGCTEEAPLFREVAGERGGELNFVNLRESAGWSSEATKAGLKMAALAATAALPMLEGRTFSSKVAASFSSTLATSARSSRQTSSRIVWTLRCW